MLTNYSVFAYTVCDKFMQRINEFSTESNIISAHYNMIGKKSEIL